MGKGKNRAVKVWHDNPRIRTRILHLFDDYLHGTKIPELMARYNISQHQVWRDIKHARMVHKEIWVGDIDERKVPLLESRRMVIAEAMEEITHARKAPISEFHSEEARARIITAYLAVISVQLKAIEAMEGFGSTRALFPTSGPTPDALPQGESSRIIAIIGAKGEGERILLDDPSIIEAEAERIISTDASDEED